MEITARRLGEALPGQAIGDYLTVGYTYADLNSDGRISPNEVTVDPGASLSLSRNTPFAGRTLTGRVRTTILNGRITAADGEVRP